MNTQTIFYYLSYASIGSGVLAFLSGIFCIKGIKGYLIPLFILVTLASGIDLMNLFLVKSRVNNFYLLHFYTSIEFSLWAIFYFMFYKEHGGTYYLILGLIPVFLAVCYADYRINGLDGMDSFSISVESILLTLFSLTSFLIILNQEIFKDLLKEPFFFINAGVLFYFLGDLCFFAFANYIYKTEVQNYMASWTLHSLLNIVFNLLICVGFWKARTI